MRERECVSVLVCECVCVCVCVCERESVCMRALPVTGAGDQYTQEAIDDEGEDDGCDGSTRNGVARVLQITLNIQKHDNTFYLRTQHNR